jgi:predicted acetyltransferase
MEFRAIEAGEVTASFATLAAAFAETSLDDWDAERDRQRLEPERLFAAIDQGKIVGCAGAFSWKTVVPGGASVGTAGISLVGVLPTHRRRGITRELMGRVLAQAAERGEALASLYSSEAAIYGRFGFGPAASFASHDIDVDRAGLPVRTDAGRVRLLSLEEALPALAHVYMAARRPGLIELDEAGVAWLFLPNPDPKEHLFYAVHEDAGGVPDAFATYRAKHDWPDDMPHVEITLKMLMAVTDDGYAAIWRFLFDVDLVHRIKAWERPLDEPLRLILAEPRALRTKRSDGLYARPVDVAAALAARSYASDGRVRIEFHDDFMRANEGRFELTVENGTASCRRVAAEPDLVADVTAIGAVYLGETSWYLLAAAGKAHERTAGALATADAMFAWHEVPWAPVVF